MSFDFDLKEISYKSDNFDSSCLELDIKGKDVHFSFINALRKVCLNQIPIYGISPQKINILKNNSVYDGTEMRNRLSQLPIKRLKHNIKFLPFKYYKNVNFADTKLERHPEDKNNIEYYLNVKNNGPDKIMYVSTDNLRISVNNEIIENNKIYKGKEPIVLIELRPGEEFECSMKAVLAIGELDGIFNSSNSYYEEITPEHYIFKIESNGQFTEYELLIIGIDIIIEKMNIIKENVLQEQYSIVITENNSVIIEITNEDYTCGGPINLTLQNMKEVKFSGISKPNYMEKNICIKFSTDKNYKPIEIFSKGIDNTIEKFENIKRKIEKISKGNIKK